MGRPLVLILFIDDTLPLHVGLLQILRTHHDLMDDGLVVHRVRMLMMLCLGRRNAESTGT